MGRTYQPPGRVDVGAAATDVDGRTVDVGFAIVGTDSKDGYVVGVGRVGDVVAGDVDVVVLGTTVVVDDSTVGAVVMGGT